MKFAATTYLNFLQFPNLKKNSFHRIIPKNCEKLIRLFHEKLAFVNRPTRPPKPSRPSRPTKKPSQQHVKWPNFHLVDQQQPTGSGSANDEKKDTTQHHFVSIKAPQDPRPTLTTRR